MGATLCGLTFGQCADARESGVLNWLRLREALGDYRRAKPLSVAELAVKLDVHETTIYRIENLKDNPDHKPELQTISDWLDATGGPTLSSFFRQIEGLSDRVLPRQDMTPSTFEDIPVGVIGGADHPLRLDPLDRAAIRREVIDEIVGALTLAGYGPIPDQSPQQATTPVSRASGGSEGDRETGG